MTGRGYMKHHSVTERRWTNWYVGLAWMAELGNGAIQTITGPMQPYLAYNLGTDTSTINLVWTLGFTGFLLGSLLTSNIFTKYLNTSSIKMGFMSFVLFLTGVSTVIMPFMYNLPMLLICRFIQFLCYGIFLTADSVLLVFTLGPQRSRPFINAVHFFISVGFLLGTFLVQPFLPEDTSHKVCSVTNSPDTTTTVPASLSSTTPVSLINGSDSGSDELIENIAGVQSIAWPFIISGGWCILVSVGFLLLSLQSGDGSLGVTMPQFYDENTNTKGKDEGPTKLSHVRKRVFLVLIVIFFALSGAAIRVFQSMSMTFAMCGPLNLEPHHAALTDSFYSTGMCVGRLASILLAVRLLPSTLLALSICASLLATLALTLLAPIYYIFLYTGVGIMGFFLSWQFGTGFSWTTHHMNITGRLSSIFFIGLGVGSLSSPPLAGWLFLMEPMAMLYLVTGMVVIQLLIVGLMWIVTKGLPCYSNSQSNNQVM